MNKLRTCLAGLIVAAAAFGPAHAADGGAAARPLQLPKLAISWNCKDCKQNDKVPPLIESAYAAAAAKAGYAVSETESVDIDITDFRQRSAGTRVMLGLFAGKDRLALRGNYHGQAVTAEDSSGNAVQGFNHLCEAVGRKMYAAIVAKARTQ